MKAIAIDLGGTNIKAAVVDQDLGIIEQSSTPTHAELGKEHLLNRIAGVVMELSKKDEVVGIGMGLPGMVSLDQTTVH